MGLGSRIRRGAPEPPVLEPDAAPDAVPRDVAQLVATGGGLRGALDRYLTGLEPSRVGSPMLHASQLFGLCTRQVLLARALKEVPQSVVPVTDRVRWDQGSAIHDLVRERYLGPMGVLYGEWRCAKCEGITTGAMPKRCRCGGRRLLYEEREVKNEELGIVGHLDGLEQRPGAGLGVLEIKTIDGALFKMLKQPQPEHTFRTHVYMWLAGLQWGRILYVSMAKERVSPFKEFYLRFDLRVAEQVRRTIEELRSGGRRCCEERQSARALRCPVGRTCFAGPGG